MDSVIEVDKSTKHAAIETTAQQCKDYRPNRNNLIDTAATHRPDLRYLPVILGCEVLIQAYELALMGSAVGFGPQAGDG